MRNAGCNRRDRGDYARVLSLLHTGLRMRLRIRRSARPHFGAKRCRSFGRPRAVITTGAIAHGCLKTESGCGVGTARQQFQPSSQPAPEQPGRNRRDGAERSPMMTSCDEKNPHKEKPRRSGVLIEAVWLTTRCGRRGGPDPSSGTCAPPAGERRQHRDWRGSRRMDRDGNLGRNRLRPESHRRRCRRQGLRAWRWLR